MALFVLHENGVDFEMMMTGQLGIDYSDYHLIYITFITVSTSYCKVLLENPIE